MTDFMNELKTNPAIFTRFGKKLTFGPGQAIVNDNEHYQYFLILVTGDAEACTAGRACHLPVGAAMGLESFLTGCATRALIRANGSVQTLRVDDEAWCNFETADPIEAAGLRVEACQCARQTTGIEGVQVVLCRTPEMLRLAQKLRYEVYCEELGRASPHADVQMRVLADTLDRFGYVFLAKEADGPIGTLRINLAANGPLGELERIYRMKDSPHHPERTAICTKFMVTKSHRHSSAAFRLLAAALACGYREQTTECYIDSTPDLLPFYKALGFTINGPLFDHPENGASYPMMLELSPGDKRLFRFINAHAGTRSKNERSNG